jgi:hypothetical protein
MSISTQFAVLPITQSLWQLYPTDRSYSWLFRTFLPKASFH